MNLRSYIQGKRKGKEAHQIEREAMRDPFLGDALDGFDAVDGDHAERITRIRERLFTTGRNKRIKLIPIGIAACFILCIGVGGFFLLQTDEQPLIARNELSPETRDELIFEEEEATIESESADELPDEPSPDIKDRVEIVSKEPIGELSAPAQLSIEEEVLSLVDDSLSISLSASADAELSLPEVAAVTEDSSGMDSFPVDKREVKRPSVTTPSSATQRAMTGSGTGKQPEPEIGMRAYKRYLKHSMILPETGSCVKKKGHVIIEFKIDEHGRPHGITLRKKLCDDLDKEAIRLVEAGPDWVGDTSKFVILEVKF